jgi:thioredoxin reductase (NADPH)
MIKTKVAIIGSGPAGYTAAIYVSRAQLKPILFTGIDSGGQLMSTSELENFPGFPEGIMGPKFMMQLKAQAEKFGTVVKPQLITAVDFSKRPFKLWTSLPKGFSAESFQQDKAVEIQQIGEKLRTTQPDVVAEAVIIATGAGANKIGIPGESEFIGRGVSVCAICDAAFFKDKKVYVIGGGDTALGDALALANFTDDVTIVYRRDQFRASQVMQERVLKHKQIKVLWNSLPKEIRGSQSVTELIIEQKGKEKVLPADGIFVAVGHHPVSNLFKNQLELDAKGYVLTSYNFSRSGLDLAKKHLDEHGLIIAPTMTTAEGVFAAGDVTDITYRQAITAAGMGAAAALDAENWLLRQT